ncbi:fibronectin type III domain-containing protein [Candidatus Gottesmanbacteria bacterium]|nr:fibronectin type III domain-containing protein [Candidatus Gottesmanbacteria bacterium]
MSSNLFKSIALFAGLALSLGILVVGVLSLRSYFTKATGSDEPNNIRTSNITGNSAQVLWNTQSDTQGLVKYSTDPQAFQSANNSSLLFGTETQAGKSHEVTLSQLKADTTYYYEIAIAEKVYGQNGLVTDNNHLPFTFTTATLSQTTPAQTGSNLDPVVFKQKFGTTDVLYDLNKDGTVNASDYLIFLSRNISPTP